MSTNNYKGNLAILSSLYELHKKYPEDKDIQRHISSICWELCFTLHIDDTYHVLAELAQSAIHDGVVSNDGYYNEEINSALEKMKADTANFYEK